MVIFQRPKIAHAIVNSPCGFSFDSALGQSQHHSANLALVGFRVVQWDRGAAGRERERLKAAGFHPGNRVRPSNSAGPCSRRRAR